MVLRFASAAPDVRSFAFSVVGLSVTRPRQRRNMAYVHPTREQEAELRLWLRNLGFPPTAQFRSLDWNDILKKNRALIREYHREPRNAEGIKQCNSAKSLFESYFHPSSSKQGFEEADEESHKQRKYDHYKFEVMEKFFAEDDKADAQAADARCGNGAGVDKRSQTSSKNKMSRSQSSRPSDAMETHRDWVDRGQQKCATWPHGCDIRATRKKKDETRAKEYVFLYACWEHCRTCAEFLLCEVGVDPNCKSTNKDWKEWALMAQPSQEREDFVEFVDHLLIHQKWNQS